VPETQGLEIIAKASLQKLWSEESAAGYLNENILINDSSHTSVVSVR
jgi:hypothetical protein